ncbi:hypothetical protein ACFYOC_05915 [Nocardiopsis alba]|uniref:Lipoprotein n=2 Tax=Nocardiopsis alba TaxID=53437 RepID=A0A7K2IU55_9ACTN|nr:MULTISPECIES: hypothetical protein [Nocardiopsis]AFR08164.1 putative lipoprotein [Nocardiopsis alba ATCC BAA-2165]MEC3893768.1 hypothetical protein [Nocardiopsis sp. LDBS1602]MYR33354.1 hypothetical protein [Nocardiopsis alba]
MRRPTGPGPFLLVGTALSLALTACGGIGGTDTEAATEVDTTGFTYGDVPTENQRGPSIDESQMPPEPERGAPRHEINAHNALVKVSEMNWTADPDATSECPPDVDLHVEKSYSCVVTYMGEEFEYLVELDEELSSENHAAERARLVTGPIIVEQLEHTIRVYSLLPYVDCGFEGEVAIAVLDEHVSTCTALDGATGETKEYEITYGLSGTAVTPL